MIAAVLYAVVVASWLLAGPAEPVWITSLRALCLGLDVDGVIIMSFSLTQAGHDHARGLRTSHPRRSR